MNTIWKWALQVERLQTLTMPYGATILTLQTQGGTPTLWALVDDSAPMVPRKFATYGTGHELPASPGRYVGTYQVLAGSLVFHVFEE